MDIMNILIDKLIILTITLVLYIPTADNIYMVIPILIVVALSAALSYFENDRITLGVFFIYMIICFLEKAFLYFIPLICYDILIFRIKWLWAMALLPLVVNSTGDIPLHNILIGVFLAVAYILKYRTVSLQNIKKAYYELQYNAKEVLIQLENKNKALMEKQDYEIKLATLNERNRIARDIHDNVGHLLSRSLLQIGALLTVCKDQNMKDNLNLIKDTLSEAMDSIRKSVHNLHEESINLQNEIQKLIDNFSFCPVEFDYDVETNPDRDLKYCFIAITKEALSNVIKHSNATKVSVVIREHPALYQLIIKDNGTLIDLKNVTKDGTQFDYKAGKGIGLKNIEDRVAALGGNFDVSINKGFRIFVSIPKDNIHKVF